MIELRLPKLGSTMDEGTIVSWQVQPGSQVNPGDVLYEVTTDKVNIEVEADYKGRIIDILVPEGAAVAVGQPVATIEGEEWESAVKPPVEETTPTKTPIVETELPVLTPIAADPPFLRASPAARRLARAMQIDLSQVRGSGPAGRIVRRDVQRLKDADEIPALPRPAQPSGAKLSGPRVLTAKRMTQSAQIPQVTLHASVDANNMQSLRHMLKTREPDSPVSLIDVVLLATVRAVGAHSAINGWLEEESFSTADPHVNLGYAVDDGTALYVVTIPQAEQLTLSQLAQARKRGTERVLNHQLQPQDIQPPSFTVTNLGPFGVEWFNPLIFPPQVGILGVGALTSDAAGARMRLSLTFDHRAIDGAPAARVLRMIRELVEQPVLML